MATAPLLLSAERPKKMASVKDRIKNFERLTALEYQPSKDDHEEAFGRSTKYFSQNFTLDKLRRTMELKKHTSVNRDVALDLEVSNLTRRRRKPGRDSKLERLGSEASTPAHPLNCDWSEYGTLRSNSETGTLNRCKGSTERLLVSESPQKSKNFAETPDEEVEVLGLKTGRIKKTDTYHAFTERCISLEERPATPETRHQRATDPWVRNWVEQVNQAGAGGGEIPVDIGRVQSEDKPQEINDFASEKSQEQQQYPETMGRSTKAIKVIGPKGGSIELLGYRIVYPPNSLKEETQIKLFIDNNPCNFPKDGLPVTSILDISPSMKLKIPALVTMPTSCVGSNGKVKVQIWGKKIGKKWKKTQTASLASENEINFETDQFSGSVVTSVNEKEKNLEHIITNRLFMQKDTGTILSVFGLDENSMEDTAARCHELEYKRILPTDYHLAGNLGDQFQVKVDCIDPRVITYSSATGDKTALFKITSTFLRARKPHSITFTHSINLIPANVECLRILYWLETLAPDIHLIKWPIEIKGRDTTKNNVAPASVTNVIVDSSKTTDKSRNVADTIAQTGARVEMTSYGTTSADKAMGGK